MSKKHIRFYLAVGIDSTSYRKIESESPFSIEEGEQSIRENNEGISKVTHIAKSKAKILGLC